MKFVIVTLAVVFNLTLVVLYSRGLVGGSPADRKPATASTPIPERSASSPYKPGDASAKSPAEAGARAVAKPAAAKPSDSKEVLEPVESGDGKETVDPKDGKELKEVAENVNALRLRSPQDRPRTEIMPGSRERGILAPANPANVDPPVVSPEAR